MRRQFWPIWGRHGPCWRSRSAFSINPRPSSDDLGGPLARQQGPGQPGPHICGRGAGPGFPGPCSPLYVMQHRSNSRSARELY
eukprot:9477590-Pyramimonas_sp.AAC.2